MDEHSVYTYSSIIDGIWIWHYTGRTKDCNRRFYQHRHLHPMCADHPDGIFSIICSGLSFEDACKMEELYIKRLETHESQGGYNKSWKSIGIDTHTDESKQKISMNHAKPHLGKTFSEEHRKNLSASKLGEKHSDERRLNNARGQTGKVLSSETRTKISNIRKDYWKARKKDENQTYIDFGQLYLEEEIDNND